MVDYARNAREYWKEHLVHIAIGAFSGYLVTFPSLAAAGATLIAVASYRQALEYQKRDDTPGIDLAYHVGGLIAGIVAGLVVRGVS